VTEDTQQTFVVVPMTVGIVALPKDFFILLVTQVNAETTEASKTTWTLSFFISP